MMCENAAGHTVTREAILGRQAMNVGESNAIIEMNLCKNHVKGVAK